MKQVIEKRKDVAFFMKMYPLVSIHPKAYNKSKTIVCEKTKSNENAIKLLEDVYAKKDIPEPPCETDVIDKNIALGQKLGINGTPTLVFSDGSLVSGALSADDLIQIIDGKKQK